MDEPVTLARGIGPTTRRRLGIGVVMAIAVMTLAGALLRVAAARGDLWLDEIWSFRLLDHVHAIPDIVFALPYDTNHVLTEIWLALVGPMASPLVVRLPAIICGTLCIPVAAHIGLRRGPVAAVAAAAVFALGYVFIHFGSEARGYAGLILATLIAYDALEGMLEEPRAVASRFTFTLAIAFGTFSHLTMIEPTAVLCATAVVRLIRTAGWRGAMAPILGVLGAAVVGTAPALVCFAVSVFSTGTLHTGLITPPSFDAFATGLGRLIRGIVGLHDGPLDPTGATLLLILGALGSALALAVLPAQRRVFPAIAILVVPWLHLALPNQIYPRFSLTLGVALALLLAEVWAQAWRHGRAARFGAVVAALLFLGGQYGNVAAFMAPQRGHYAAAVALLSQTGPTTFSALPLVLDGETNATVQWYAQRREPVPQLTHVAAAGPCATAPNWMIIVRTPNAGLEAPQTTTTGPEACRARYTLRESFPAYGFSGSTWTLYRRADALP